MTKTQRHHKEVPDRVQYRKHDTSSSPEYRIRMCSWPGDRFEVISNQRFHDFLNLSDALGIKTENLDETEP